jgi:hypothetical protein
MILCGFIGGTCRTSMVFCIHPGDKHLVASLSTLENAMYALHLSSLSYPVVIFRE